LQNKLVVALVALLLFALPASAEQPSKPTRVAGIVYGAAVGVPIKIARDIASETKRMTATLETDFDAYSSPRSSLLRPMIYLMTVPYGLLSGSILGTVHGMSNACKYGYEQPFSRASISLDEDEVAMKTSD